ncbi:MAG TPA: pitrilysin family protein [Natronosporangium sp.]|nr:pitrilysin family protein [Natronosporangium sp.]
MPRSVATRTLARDRDGGLVRRTVLPSGVRIITEAVPSVRSVAVGVWVAVGSRDESPRLAGASHFLEHLLFKGTRRRTALQISAEIEGVGGDTNAFTSKEYTCYYARVLDDHLPLAIDVICDLVTGATLAPADVETERAVILEEIAMLDDEPGEEVHDLFARALYGTHPLGRRVIGTVETIAPMTRRQIHDYYRRHYTAPSTVVAAAGRLDHGTVVRLVRRALAGTPLGDGTAEPAPPRRGRRPPRVTGGGRVEQRDTEQAHLVAGVPTFGRGDERRFALGVLNNILGGGMSSRLFQVVREQRGLAYSCYSYTHLYAETGMLGIYAGCAPGKADQVVGIVRDELARMCRHGVTDAELARGKGMLAGAFALDLEDTGARMTRLAKGELLHDRLLTVDELRARVDRVTRAQVNDLAAQLLSGPLTLAAIGPVDPAELAVG